VFGILGLDPRQHVAIDPRYFRPSEVDLLLGDPSKAKRLLNWKPKVNFKELARMMTEADWELAKQEKLLVEEEKRSPGKTKWGNSMVSRPRAE